MFEVEGELTLKKKKSRSPKRTKRSQKSSSPKKSREAATNSDMGTIIATPTRKKSPEKRNESKIRLVSIESDKGLDVDGRESELKVRRNKQLELEPSPLKINTMARTSSSLRPDEK